MIVLFRDEMDWSVWAKVEAGRIVSYIVTAREQVRNKDGFVFYRPVVPSDDCVWLKSINSAWICRQGGAHVA